MFILQLCCFLWKTIWEYFHFYFKTKFRIQIVVWNSKRLIFMDSKNTIILQKARLDCCFWQLIQEERSYGKLSRKAITSNQKISWSSFCSFFTYCYTFINPLRPTKWRSYVMRTAFLSVCLSVCLSVSQKRHNLWTALRILLIFCKMAEKKYCKKTD